MPSAVRPRRLQTVNAGQLIGTSWERRCGSIDFGSETDGCAERLFTCVSTRRLSTAPDRFVIYDRAQQTRRPRYVRKLPALELGDGAFAEQFAVHGDESATAARLSQSERRQIVAARPWCVLGQAGVVTLFLRGRITASERIRAAMQLVVALDVDRPDTSEGPYR